MSESMRKVIVFFGAPCIVNILENIGKLRHRFLLKFRGTHASNHFYEEHGPPSHHFVSRNPCFCDLFAVSKILRHQVAA